MVIEIINNNGNGPTHFGAFTLHIRAPNKTNNFQCESKLMNAYTRRTVRTDSIVLLKFCSGPLWITIRMESLHRWAFLCVCARVCVQMYSFSASMRRKMLPVCIKSNRSNKYLDFFFARASERARRILPTNQFRNYIYYGNAAQWDCLFYLLMLFAALFLFSFFFYYFFFICWALSCCCCYYYHACRNCCSSQ